MRIGQIKPIYGKWQFELRLDRDFARMMTGWYRFRFVIIKMKYMPAEGEYIDLRLGKGIDIKFRYWLPFDRY